MNLTETNGLATASLPIAEFKDFLQLGRGFTDDGAQDSILEICLRAAMGAIEARTSKTLISRAFQWKTSRYPLEDSALVFPTSPVTWLLAFRTEARDGTTKSFLGSDFIIRQDSQREKLAPKSGYLPEIPDGGVATVVFIAGYATWGGVPSGLRQAMLMLAACYYENRDAMINGGGQMPLAVATLLAPFQRIRLGGRT